MTALHTTYNQLLERVIDDGIAEVQTAYAAPEEHHMRDGALQGFEDCRGKQPAELVTCWQAAEDQARQIMRDGRDIKKYWRQRYKALQIEFVLNVISVGRVNSGQAPLLGHLPTARGAMKYAAIVGVGGGSGA